MKSANNSALFTDVSAEESSTVNGGVVLTGRFYYKPILSTKYVYNPRTGRYGIKHYVQYKPIYRPYPY